MMSTEQWCVGGKGGHDVNGAMVCVREVGGGGMMSADQWCVCLWGGGAHDVTGVCVGGVMGVVGVNMMSTEQ